MAGLLTLGLAGPAAPVAQAQCNAGWVPMGTPQGWPGVNDVVWASTTWDPDGAGALPPVAVVGGQFTVAGAVLANRVATWNGSEWQSLGTGLTGTVFALAVYNGQLYAGGNFALPGGNHLARWTGSSWQPVAGGLNGQVLTLRVIGSDLYVGGQFTTAGTTTAKNIARFNGSTYAALGVGAGGPSFESVRVITLHNGLVYVGGGFETAGGLVANNIATWNPATSTWGVLTAPNGVGVSDIVYAIASWNNQLFLGGGFTTAGGDTTIDYVASWNGTTFATVGSNPDWIVRSLEVHNGQLIMGGQFGQIGPGNVSRLAAWNGVAWQPVGVGLANHVYTTTTYNGQLLFGGTFFNSVAAGDLIMGFVGLWNGLDYVSLGGGPTLIGGDAAVFDFSLYNNQLIVGGQFSTLGGQRIRNIARWNGSSWSGLGTGITGNWVTTSQAYANDLYVGGRFTLAGSTPAANIARWNGSSWNTVSTGTNGDVLDMVVFNGNLIVGGSFTSAGGVAGRNRVAQWNGTAWSALGTGLNDTVRALIVYNNELYAGGDFNSTQGGAANAVRYVARWNGAQWVALAGGTGSGTNFTPVFCLGVYNNRLIVGGSFTTVNSIPANRIAAWDGAAWEPLAGGLTDVPYAMTTFNGLLYVVGDPFQTPSGTAIWNGSSWTPMGTGVNGRGEDIAAFNNRLYVGGNFLLAGGAPAVDIATYAPGGTSRTITQQPQSQAVCANANVNLSIGVSGGGPYVYTWRRNGVALPQISGISGVATPTLTISGFRASDAGIYDVVVTDACGTFLSEQATLTLNSGTCPVQCDDVDFNNDGIEFDPTDLEAFLSVYSGGPCF